MNISGYGVSADNRHFRLEALARQLCWSGHLEHDGIAYEVGRGEVWLLPAALGICKFRPTAPVNLFEIAIPK
jgi:hypothetical protein